MHCTVVVIIIIIPFYLYPFETPFNLTCVQEKFFEKRIFRGRVKNSFRKSNNSDDYVLRHFFREITITNITRKKKNEKAWGGKKTFGSRKFPLANQFHDTGNTHIHTRVPEILKNISRRQRRKGGRLDGKIETIVTR